MRSSGTDPIYEDGHGEEPIFSLWTAQTEILAITACLTEHEAVTSALQVDRRQKTLQVMLDYLSTHLLDIGDQHKKFGPPPREPDEDLKS